MQALISNSIPKMQVKTLKFGLSDDLDLEYLKPSLIRAIKRNTSQLELDAVLCEDDADYNGLVNDENNRSVLNS
jgi:hypothetical protein